MFVGNICVAHALQWLGVGVAGDTKIFLPPSECVSNFTLPPMDNYFFSDSENRETHSAPFR
jgi:hypothetical protein